MPGAKICYDLPLAFSLCYRKIRKGKLIRNTKNATFLYIFSTDLLSLVGCIVRNYYLQ